MYSTVSHYINLTKPKIVILFTITGFASLVLEGSLLDQPQAIVLVLLAMTLTAASANALNMYCDRDIDAIMERTRHKRPLPLGLLKKEEALLFGIITGTIAFLLSLYLNPMTAFLSLFTIMFYVFIYTRWLKRTTHHNTFLGGIAGATAPLMGWAAASGEISPLAWSLFAIILFWSPPHFWALAITLKEDYGRANIPMLPVKFGEAKTRKAIFWYTLVLAAVSLSPYFIGGVSAFYLCCAIVLNSVYIWKTVEMLQKKTHAYCKHLFFVSLLYITWLFIFLLVDAIFFRPFV